MNPWERDWSRPLPPPWERQWSKPEAEDPGTLKTMAVSMGNWLDSKAAGLRGAVRDYVPGGESIVSATDRLDRALGVEPPTEKTRAAAAPIMKALDDKNPKAMFAGSFAGDMAAKTPIGMAVLGGLDPGTTGERLLRAGIGYGAGKLGEGVGYLAGKVMGRSSADAAPKLADEFFDATASNKWNIPTSVGQRTQNKPAQIMESVVGNLPGGAGVMAKAHDRTFGGFNRAVAGTFGEDATKLTPEVLGDAKRRIGGVFNEVSKRNSLDFGDEAFNGLVRIQERAKTDLTPADASIVTQWTNNIIRDVDPNSKMAGTLYKAYDSKLGKLAKTSQGTLADVLADLRGVMREAMDKSISEADKAAWSKARREYLNLQTVADAAKNTGDGSLSPARLIQAVNAAQKNAKFGSGNDLADLAQWAKATLPDKIPNSGTAQRQFYQQLLTNPLATAGLLGGGAYGADSLGIGPAGAATGVAAPYLIARALAGKPTSAGTDELLKRLGVGLLGGTALQYAP